ncbi:MAG: (d)CMP kinase [Deltaproteobacteria bacterium]|jgi:cytidylate kinase|nr:(d)CMP kinase [Deltaproteobacteria bacterium]
MENEPAAGRLLQRSGIITIDGLSGTGKSTLAGSLARRLGWLRLDSGAIYRALAFLLLERGTADPSPQEAGKLAYILADEMDPQLFQGEIYIGVRLAGRELGGELRTRPVSELASKAAAMPEVCQALLPFQRAQGLKGNLVAEGRDMGSAVFPQAELKIVLKASAEVRAVRRYTERQKQGLACSYPEVLAEQLARDRSDEVRLQPVLAQKPAAVRLDTTDLSAASVLNRALELAQTVFGLRPSLEFGGLQFSSPAASVSVPQRG